MAVLKCICKKDPVKMGIIEAVTSNQRLNSSILFRLGTMEAMAISNRALLNVKAIIYPETLN